MCVHVSMFVFARVCSHGIMIMKKRGKQKERDGERELLTLYSWFLLNHLLVILMLCVTSSVHLTFKRKSKKEKKAKESCMRTLLLVPLFERLARIKAEAKRKREERELQARLRQQERERRQQALMTQFAEWNVPTDNNRVELSLVRCYASAFLSERLKQKLLFQNKALLIFCCYLICLQRSKPCTSDVREKTPPTSQKGIFWNKYLWC